MSEKEVFKEENEKETEVHENSSRPNQDPLGSSQTAFMRLTSTSSAGSQHLSPPCSPEPRCGEELKISENEVGQLIKMVSTSATVGSPIEFPVVSVSVQMCRSPVPSNDGISQPNQTTTYTTLGSFKESTYNFDEMKPHTLRHKGLAHKIDSAELTEQHDGSLQNRKLEPQPDLYANSKDSSETWQPGMLCKIDPNSLGCCDKLQQPHTYDSTRYPDINENVHYDSQEFNKNTASSLSGERKKHKIKQDDKRTHSSSKVVDLRAAAANEDVPSGFANVEETDQSAVDKTCDATHVPHLSKRSKIRNVIETAKKDFTTGAASLLNPEESNESYLPYSANLQRYVIESPDFYEHTEDISDYDLFTLSTVAANFGRNTMDNSPLPPMATSSQAIPATLPELSDEDVSAWDTSDSDGESQGMRI